MGKLVNKVSVTGTPVTSGYNVTSTSREYVDIVPQREASNESQRNRENIVIGDENAQAIGLGIASNNVKIISS